MSNSKNAKEVYVYCSRSTGTEMAQCFITAVYSYMKHTGRRASGRGVAVVKHGCN